VQPLHVLLACATAARTAGMCYPCSCCHSGALGALGLLLLHVRPPRPPRRHARHDSRVLVDNSPLLQGRTLRPPFSCAGTPSVGCAWIAPELLLLLLLLLPLGAVLPHAPGLFAGDGRGGVCAGWSKASSQHRWLHWMGDAHGVHGL